MTEFEVSIYYRYISKSELSKQVSKVVQLSGMDPGNISIPVENQESTAVVDTADAPHIQGTVFTKLGPAPYAGDILDDPELLWTEDVWNEERSAEAHRKLAEQGRSITGYWKNQYESKAGTYWHKFYKRNADHFYKDRHYLHLVFPELLGGSATTPLHLLEVGCGVGNAVLPLIEINPNIHVVAMDFAKSAIEILNKHPFALSCFDEDIAGPVVHSSTTNNNSNNNDKSNIDKTSQVDSSQQSQPDSDGTKTAAADVIAKRRVRTAVRCVVNDALPVDPGSMDLALCMFVLSAISPTEQLVALKKIADVLPPGGKLLVRDYGR